MAGGGSSGAQMSGRDLVGRAGCRWPLAAAAGLLLAQSAAGAWAYSFQSCGPNCVLRWPNGPILVHVHEDARRCDVAAMERATFKWNTALAQVEAGVRIVLAGYTRKYGLQQDGMNTVSLMRASWPAQRKAGGATRLWRKGSRIVEGDIILNLQDYRFHCDLPETRGIVISLEQVMEHELGHFLGLDHAESGIMISKLHIGEMHTTTGTGTAVVDPDAREGLRVLYGR